MKMADQQIIMAGFGGQGYCRREEFLLTLECWRTRMYHGFRLTVLK